MRTVMAVTASPSASSLDIAKSYFCVAGHGAETLQYLEVFDAINADVSKPSKIASFEADPQAKGRQ